MGRRRSSSIAGSPLLIGAITTLIAIVAVYLSYNANNGLPFVPTYKVKVELPQASGLQDQNQVRVGGTRVGTVETLSPYLNPRTGRTTAIATLKLEKKVEPLPADTTAEVQSVSTIGLKYLELHKGLSPRTIKAGQTIPLSHTREPVNIEELFNMFDKPTRTAIKVNTINFGNGAGAPQPGLARDRPARVLERAQPGLRADGAGGAAERQLLR
jgi:ABC-type transporter Mla subunit MlaD